MCLSVTKCLPIEDAPFGPCLVKKIYIFLRLQVYVCILPSSQSRRIQKCQRNIYFSTKVVKGFDSAS